MTHLGSQAEYEELSINSSTSEDTLFDIMRLVEQQCTHAYRPFARKKPVPGSSARAAKLPAIHSKQSKVATKMETLAVAKKGKGKPAPVGK